MKKLISIFVFIMAVLSGCENQNNATEMITEELNTTEAQKRLNLAKRI